MLSKLVSSLSAQQSAVFHLQYCMLVYEFWDMFLQFQKTFRYCMQNSNELKLPIKVLSVTSSRI